MGTCATGPVPADVDAAASGTVRRRGVGRLKLRSSRLGEKPTAARASAVFVVGCPRSGTTFLGEALGALPGYVNAGELLFDLIPALIPMDRVHAARRLREALAREGFDLAASASAPVIHSPELVFLVPALQLMDPNVGIIHSVRDGRDVVASLLSLGWLSDRPPDGAANDRGREWTWGSAARFWTEATRAQEFPAVSDARRAAWAWRRHVESGLSHVGARGRTATLRYEAMCADPGGAAAQLAPVVGIDRRRLARALAGASTASVGRWRVDLTPEQLADVDDEAGALLRRLGFT